MKAELSPTPKQPIQTIFIADDDADDQLLFRQALHEVTPSIHLQVIDNGKDLLSLLQNFKPDLLFLDLDMPSKNGLQCLQAIRSNPVFSDLMVIVFSSTIRPANIAAAYEMGANLFMVKPSFYQQLLDALQTVVSLDWSDHKLIEELKFQNNPFFASYKLAEDNINNSIS